MVFSLFKKKAQKVPEREIMRPKPAFSPKSDEAAQAADDGDVKSLEPLPDLEFSRGAPSVPPGRSATAAKQKTQDEIDLEMSDFDREFTESNVMAIDVDHGAESIQSDVEQVAVLYANGHDQAVRGLLESLLGAYPGTEGLRLWHMLFDFLQLVGDRPAFDKLAVRFVEACEMSPPPWRQVKAKDPSAGPKVAFCRLQGVLTGDDMSVLTPLADAIKLQRLLRVDCSGVLGCEDEIAGRLAELLMSARRQGAMLVLEEVAGLITRLRSRVVAGEAKNARSWLLLLELLQRHGTQEDFEQCAVDFAVTFERSPPSWEVLPALPASEAEPLPADDALYLSGEIKNSRFDDLTAVSNLHDSVVLDFSGVRRLDFFSAGQLVTKLAALKDGGREVTIRSPNHLVAELMAVFGINKFARIIVPKS
jgi:anti-anti-sigma regulatory factor